MAPSSFEPGFVVENVSSKTSDTFGDLGGCLSPVVLNDYLVALKV